MRATWFAVVFISSVFAPATVRAASTNEVAGKVGSYSFGAEAERRFADQYRVICGIPDGSPVDLMHPSCPAGASALDGFRRAIGGTVNGDWSAAFRAYLSRLPEAARAYLVQHCSPDPLTNGACQKELWAHPSEEWTKAIGSDEAQFEALEAWERLEVAAAYRNVWVYQCARAVGAMREEQRDGSTVVVVTDESLVEQCNVEPSKAWSRDDLRFQKPTCGTDGECKPRQPDDPELLFLAPGIPAPWELKTQCKPWLSAARSSCVDPADNPYSPKSLLAAGVVQDGQPLSPQAEETYRMVLEMQAERMLVRINSFRVGELRDALKKMAAAAGQSSVNVDEDVRKTCSTATEFPRVQIPPAPGNASPDPSALKKLRADVAGVAEDANLIARRLRAQDEGVFSQGGKCGAFETWVEAPDRSLETARKSRAECDFERRRRAEYQDQSRALASMYPFLYVELDGKPAFALLARAQGEQAKAAVLARAYGELERFELEQISAICSDPVGEQGTFALANEGLMERYFQKYPEERAGAEMLCSLDASRSVLDQNTAKLVEFGGWVGGAASLGAILVPPWMGAAAAADIAFSVDTLDRAWRAGRQEDMELGDALAGISLEPGQGREALQLIHRYYGWDRTAEKAGAVTLAAAPWVMNAVTAALGGEARAARAGFAAEEEGKEQLVRASRPKGASAGSTAGSDAVAGARPRIEIPDHPPTEHPDGLVPTPDPHVQPEIAPPMLREPEGPGVSNPTAGGEGRSAGPSAPRWGPPPKRTVTQEPSLYVEDVPEPRALPAPSEPHSPPQARGPPAEAHSSVAGVADSVAPARPLPSSWSRRFQEEVASARSPSGFGHNLGGDWVDEVFAGGGHGLSFESEAARAGYTKVSAAEFDRISSRLSSFKQTRFCEINPKECDSYIDQVEKWLQGKQHDPPPLPTSNRGKPLSSSDSLTDADGWDGKMPSSLKVYESTVQPPGTWYKGRIWPTKGAQVHRELHTYFGWGDATIESAYQEMMRTVGREVGSSNPTVIVTSSAGRGTRVRTFIRKDPTGEFQFFPTYEACRPPGDCVPVQALFPEDPTKLVTFHPDGRAVAPPP